MHTRHTHRVASALVFGAAVSFLAACADEVTAPDSVAERPSPRAPSRAVSARATLLPRAVVVFRDSASIPSGGLSLVASLGGRVARRYDDIGVAFVDGLSAAALAQLGASALVKGVALDRYLRWLPNVRVGPAVAADAVALPKADPARAAYYADGTQWNMRVIGADRAWAAGLFGTHATRVAILDTGIDYGNRELTGLVDLAASESFSHLALDAAGNAVTLPVEPQLPGDSAFMDNHFHGTHVASTVASNLRSVASVAPHVTLVAVKVLDVQGSGTFEGVVAGIRHAAGPARAHVINMSLGAEIDRTEDGALALFDVMARAIRWAESQGTIVISAAGNSALNLDAGDLVATPCEQSTLCVSATGPINQVNYDRAATYTNYGITAIEVAAPGGNAPADDSETGVNADLIIGACSRRASEPGLAPCRLSVDGASYFYAYAAGTSMASPHVAGLAALMKSRWPGMSVSTLRARILSSSDDIGVKGRDVWSNYGRINVARGLGL